jgi:hypothetical protein
LDGIEAAQAATTATILRVDGKIDQVLIGLARPRKGK